MPTSERGPESGLQSLEHSSRRDSPDDGLRSLLMYLPLSAHNLMPHVHGALPNCSTVLPLHPSTFPLSSMHHFHFR
ncbi:hypothetical protein ACLKA6_015241 [Drosophila palustris]